MIAIEQVYCATDVQSHLREGQPKLLTRITPDALYRRAGKLEAGAFDFDGTLTAGSEWRAMGSLMRPDLHDIEMDNFRWYLSHISGQCSNVVSLDDPDWWMEHLESGNLLAVESAWVTSSVYLMRLSGITEEQLDDVAKTLSPREGALELLRLMDKRVVISFGIEQFIKSWLRHVDVSAAVAATRIIFDDAGLVNRCHINVVGAGSKKFVVKRFRDLSHVREDHLLVVGDTVLDASMMSPSSFNVLIIPPNEIENQNSDFRNNLPKMWDRLTAILVCDSLAPLAELIKEARKS
jgi:phosphoserine phosphatase